MNFTHIIGNLTNTTNVGFYMIHLERATERISIIERLENKLQMKLNVFEGANGYKLIEEGHPTTCQQRGPPFTRCAGDIGCTVSHINICRDALLKKYEYIVIFEDDCEFTSDLSSLHHYINEFITLNLSWDLFLLGLSPNVSHYMNNTFSKVIRFDLTHACVLKESFMKELIKTYEDYYNNNTTLSVDTMYSNILETTTLCAYGFNHPLFIQKQGMYSYIVEKVR